VRAYLACLETLAYVGVCLFGGGVGGLVTLLPLTLVHMDTNTHTAPGHVDSLYHEGKIVVPGVEGVPGGQVRA
jgi:hypothetical protein